MTVKTKQVTGRRNLRFNSHQEVLADAERVAAGGYKTLGNWSLGQNLEHLARTLNIAIDGTPYRAPFFLRWLGPFIKKPILRNKMAAGFKMSKTMAQSFGPRENTTTEEGLAELRKAINRFETESKRAPHVVFGEMTNEEWDQLMLRHAELHLSFVVPVE